MTSYVKSTLSAENIERLGLPTALVVVMFFLVVYLIKSNQKQTSLLLKDFKETFKQGFSEIKISIDGLNGVVGKYLTRSNSIIVFDYVMDSHVEKKLRVVKQILEKNDIVNKRDVIVSKVETRFKEIARHEANILSGFTTELGDLGNKFWCLIDWVSFLDETNSIIFGEGVVETKLDDLRVLMESYISDIKELMFK